MTPDDPTDLYHHQLTALYYLGAPLCKPPEGIVVDHALRVGLHELEVALLRIQVEILKRNLSNP